MIIKLEFLSPGAVGSGQASAHPFLAFLRRALWNDGIPTIAQGMFGISWTLDHVIKSNPGGIGGDPQLAVLDRTGTDWQARMLTTEDLAEQRQALGKLEKYLREYGKPAPATDTITVPIKMNLPE